MAKPVVGMRCFTSHQRREMRAFLIEKYGEVCQLCKLAGKSKSACAIDMEANTNHDKRSFSIDHIVPLADGGENHIDNMWPSHKGCNTLKGSKAGGTPRKYRSNNRNRLAYTSVSA